MRCVGKMVPKARCGGQCVNEGVHGSVENQVPVNQHIGQPAVPQKSGEDFTNAWC